MKKLSYRVDGIFPTPIYLSNLTRNFTKKEQQFFKKHGENIRKNTGNDISIDTYVLERPEFKKLKKELLNHLNAYGESVLSLKDAEIFITQSWLNYTQENQYHHTHEHPYC